MAVGQVLGADGTIPATGRQTKTGEAGVQQVHGKYYEASSRGALYFASVAGAGIAVTNAQALGTTAMFSLYNPAGSGKRLAVKRVRVGYISGTLAAGSLYHCINSGSVAAPSGTTITSICTDAGSQSSVAAVGVAKSVATVTAPVAIGAICSFGAGLASTATFPSIANEDVDGEIVVEPGYGYQIQALVAGAGTSPLLTLGVTWEEIPIVASNG